MPIELTSLTRIQKGIDNLISKHGSESAANIIEAISLEKNSEIHKHSIAICSLITKEVTVVFKISYKLISTGVTSNYKDARKCCYYLLNKHCKMSQANIKRYLPKHAKTTGSINGCIKSMKEVIDLPRINKPLHEKFTTIENKILKFKTTNIPISNI